MSGRWEFIPTGKPLAKYASDGSQRRGVWRNVMPGWRVSGRDGARGVAATVSLLRIPEELRTQRKIRDAQTLWLIRLIIDSSNPQEEVLAELCLERCPCHGIYSAVPLPGR